MSRNEFQHLLTPTNEVWDKVICLQVCVFPKGKGVSHGGTWSRGAWSWGCLVPGDVWSEGLVLGGCLVQRGAWSGVMPALGGLVPGVPGGDPPYGYCCRRYVSYWNAFLFKHMIT